jgi:hypothetical protein
MAFKNPSPVTESTLELRLTTTMTGGVSLAMWMAVAAREINLLAQASQWRSPRGTFSTHGRLRESAASLKPYAELIDMVIDVDILSGTGARGINAAALTSSRVTRSDLDGRRDLWLDLGALTDLLRDPRDKNTLAPEKGDVYTLLKVDLAKLTVTEENSPSNDSLNGGSQVAQAVSQVTYVIPFFMWGKMIVQLVVWTSVAGELKWLTAVMVPWLVHVSEQLKGSSCHNT